MKNKMCLFLACLALSGCVSARKADDLRYGMSRDEVLEILGSPKSSEWAPGKKTLTYDLVIANKFWQAALAIPTCGVVFAIDRRFELEFEEDKLSSVQDKGPGAGSRGVAAFGEGFSNAQKTRINCTSVQYGNQVQTTCY